MLTLRRCFFVLNQEEQRFAEIVLLDLDNGRVILQEGKGFRDYITEYIIKAKNDGISRVAENIGVNEEMLRELIDAHPNEDNLDLHNRFTELCNSIDAEKAKEYFSVSQKYQAIRKAKAKLRSFILSGGRDNLYQAYRMIEPSGKNKDGDMLAAEDEL